MTPKELDEVLDALYSALNCEGAAKAATMVLHPYFDLDTEYHFDKVRRAVFILEEEKGL